MSSFSAQTAINSTLTRGFAGMRADSSQFQVESGIACSRRLVSIALTAANSTHYITTITQNGVATAYDYTSDSSATTAEIALGLKALINAGTQSVLASGTDTPLLIESTKDGTDWDFSVAYNGNMVESVLVTQSEAIPFGGFVCRDERSTVERAVRQPRQSTDVTAGLARGFALADMARADNAATYPVGASVAIMRKGKCLVLPEQTVADGDAVYIRYAAGGTLGAAGNTAGSTERALLPGAYWRSAGSTTVPAIVEYSAP